MRRKNDNCEGSLTVEAALSLILYVLGIFSLLALIQCLRIQSKSRFVLAQSLLFASDSATLAQSVTGRESFRFAGDLSFELFVQEGLDMQIPEGLQQRMENVSIEAFSEGDRIEGKITYDLTLPGFLRSFGPIHVVQEQATGIWNIPEGMFAANEDERGNDKGSIWQESPFKRGRYFAEKQRKEGNGRILRKGEGFDLYFSPNILAEVVSLNIYDATYSKEGVIKEGALQKKIDYYAQKCIDDLEKLDEITFEDGGKMAIPSVVALSLRIVVPQEAKTFKDTLEKMAQEVYAKKGVMIAFYYQEKAFP